MVCFKAHHQNWTRVPSDFNQTEWMLNHTALLNERIANWEIGGYSVEAEGQNSFQLRGKAATLSGKPDLIVRREDGDEAVIIDGKTGHESPSHIVQVMIYLYAIPRALEPYRNVNSVAKSPTATTRSSYRRTLWTNNSCRTLES